MSKRKYGLKIDYRMTCEKSDPKNYCQDKNREKGFYWLEAKNDALQEQLEMIGITDEMSLDEIQERLERVSVPEGCEAIKAELYIYLSGSTGCNGTYRRNVDFKYFRDFLSDLEELVPCCRHEVSPKEGCKK